MKIQYLMMQANSNRNITITIMTDPETQKKHFHIINKLFLITDLTLVIICFLSSLLFSTNTCLSYTLQIYQLLYIIQTIQHYLIYKFPTIDINKHHVLYRRLVILICLVDMAYMLLCITFWQKTQYHPVYCVLCVQHGWGAWIGLVFIPHQIFLIGWGITLINAYVTRRYYLLALGGFQAEQRIIQQRARQLRQMMIIEPDLNPYTQAQPPRQKYYTFEDVTEPEDNYLCSICLNKRVEDDHFVNAGCGHYFHNICLIQWAQVNQNCPQCRRKFKEYHDDVIVEQEEQYQQDVEQNQNRQLLKDGQNSTTQKTQSQSPNQQLKTN